jgi:hypothetical protein
MHITVTFLPAHLCDDVLALLWNVSFHGSMALNDISLTSRVIYHLFCIFVVLFVLLLAVMEHRMRDGDLQRL